MFDDLKVWRELKVRPIHQKNSYRVRQLETGQPEELKPFCQPVEVTGSTEKPKFRWISMDLSPALLALPVPSWELKATRPGYDCYIAMVFRWP